MSKVCQVKHGMRRLRPIVKETKNLKEYKAEAEIIASIKNLRVYYESKSESLAKKVIKESTQSNKPVTNYLEKSREALENAGVIKKGGDISKYVSSVNGSLNRAGQNAISNAKSKASSPAHKGLGNDSTQQDVEVEQQWYSRFYDECKEFVSHPINWTKEKIGIGSYSVLSESGKTNISRENIEAGTLDISEGNLTAIDQVEPKVLEVEEPAITCDFHWYPKFRSVLSNQIELPSSLKDVSSLSLSGVAPELTVDVFALGSDNSIENQNDDSISSLLKPLVDIVQNTVGDIT